MKTMLWIYFGWMGGEWLRRLCLLLETRREVPNLTTGSTAPIASVSVIIPARNEEKNISRCLESLILQENTLHEIIVVNDRSGDGTQHKITELGFKEISSPAAGKRRTLEMTEAPTAGWTGKNNALAQVSRFAGGKCLLFTDADTVHESKSVAQAVHFAESQGLVFLSLLPRAIMESPAEEIIQPIAMGLLGLWFPLARVNRLKESMVFANGQFLLIRRDVYESLGGHAAVAAEFLEDFALMRKVKKAGLRAMTAFGMNLYGTRMYSGFAEIWRGWRRIYRHAFDSSPQRLAVAAAGVFLFSILPWIVFLTALAGGTLDRPGTLFAVIVLSFIFLLTRETAKFVKAPAISAWLHPFAATILFGILLDALRGSLLNSKTRWRG